MKTLLVALLVCHSLSLYANDSYIDSNRVYFSILDIAHFNSDQSLDTLYGVGISNNIFPRYISWGNDSNRVTSIPTNLLVDRTKISYPDFEEIQITGFTEYLNQDTLKDLVLYSWGKKDTNSTQADTIKSLIVFGQDGMDTISTFNIGSIDSVSYGPVISIEPKIGRDISSFKVRDYTYIPSFEFSYIDYTVEPPPGSIQIPTNIDYLDEIIVKLYPNPAYYYTNVEMVNVEPGTYSLTLVDGSGKAIQEISFEVYSKGPFTEVLNLENIFTGNYTLLVKSNEKFIGAFKLVVIK